MAKRRRRKGQTLMYKILHRKLNRNQSLSFASKTTVAATITHISTIDMYIKFP